MSLWGPLVFLVTLKLEHALSVLGYLAIRRVSGLTVLWETNPPKLVAWAPTYHLTNVGLSRVTISGASQDLTLNVTDVAGRRGRSPWRWNFLANHKRLMVPRVSGPPRGCWSLASPD